MKEDFIHLLTSLKSELESSKRPKLENVTAQKTVVKPQSSLRADTTNVNRSTITLNQGKRETNIKQNAQTKT